MSLHETNFEPSAAIAGHSLAALLSCKGAVSPEIRRISYGQVAYEAAVENGLLPEELDGFLAGAAITDLGADRGGGGEAGCLHEPRGC